MMKSCQNRTPVEAGARFGLTLLEVLVALSVIALLIAVTLPAVQSARESSRKANCQNRLRQIVSACDQFETAHRHYPPSQLGGQHGVGPDSTAWSFLSRLLPFLDQQNLYSEGGIPEKTLRASGIAARQLPIFLCPSDPFSSQGPRDDAGNMVGFQFAVGQTNYKGVGGANWGADEAQNWSPVESGTRWPNPSRTGSYDGLNHGDGMWRRADLKNPRKRIHISDGLSNSFSFGEALPQYDAYCSWPYSNNVHSTCAIPPNLIDETDPRDWPNAQSFRSQHWGGLFFAFSDGSVRFINQSIDLPLYRALATIAGREIVSPP